MDLNLLKKVKVINHLNEIFNEGNPLELNSSRGMQNEVFSLIVYDIGRAHNDHYNVCINIKNKSPKVCKN